MRKFILNFPSSSSSSDDDDDEEEEDIKPKIEPVDWSIERSSNQNGILTGVGYLCHTPQAEDSNPLGAVFTCMICNLDFCSRLQLEEHEQSCEKEVPEEEEDIKPDDIETLVQKCKRRRTYYCKHCKYKTVKRQEFTNHLLKHIFDNNCKNVTNTKSVESVVAPHRYKGNKRYKCSIRQCFFSTDSSHDLTRHLGRHNSIKVINRIKRGGQYACSNCNYTTKSSSLMHSHSCVPTERDRRFACAHCPYRAAQKDTLTLHIQIHMNEKPFACPYCEYRSLYKYSLKNHLARHTGDFKYACDQCDFKTVLRRSLVGHMRIHTGEKPFACPQCPYRTRQQGALYSHLKRHSGERPWSCELCHYRCVFKQGLAKHMEVRHK